MIGISVIVATYNSAASLRALLASLEQLEPPPVPYEIIVADNGSRDETPSVLADWCARSPQDRVVVEVMEQGKCCAVNRALAVARGELLVFFDHDIVVDRRHLREVFAFFQTHDCWAAQGAIGWPPETPTETVELAQRFGGIPHFEGRIGERLSELIGANMVIRREALNKVGLFDERLGPGMTGYCEDSDMATRIVSHGGQIGVMHNARVTHEMNPVRLTVEYHREAQRKAGASAYRQKPRGLYTWIVPKLIIAGVRRAVFRGFCGVNRNVQMAGRWYHYQGMLRTALKDNEQSGRKGWLKWLAKLD